MRRRRSSAAWRWSPAARRAQFARRRRRPTPTDHRGDPPRIVTAPAATPSRAERHGRRPAARAERDHPGLPRAAGHVRRRPGHQPERRARRPATTWPATAGAAILGSVRRAGHRGVASASLITDPSAGRRLVRRPDRRRRRRSTTATPTRSPSCGCSTDRHRRQLPQDDRGARRPGGRRQPQPRTSRRSSRTQVDAARESVAGVNIDEEMTNMLSFQHAYAAAGRMVTAIDETLDVADQPHRPRGALI